MKKLISIGILGFILFCLAAYYFLVDDELSEQTIYWLEQDRAAKDLTNNVFIHLMSLNEKTAANYQLSKQNYLEKVALSKVRFLDFEEMTRFPARVVEQDLLPENLNCLPSADNCLEQLKNQREYIAEQLNNNITLVREFINNSTQYDYQQPDVHSSIGDFEHFHTVNYLASLAIYFDILDGNLDRAEQTLFNYLYLLRQVSESSLDVGTSAVFIVAVEQLIQPLFEELVSSGHTFKSQSNHALYQIPVKEITLQKIAVSEIAKMHRTLTEYIYSDGYVDPNFYNNPIAYIGFKPNKTLNSISSYWQTVTLPDSIAKRDFLEARSNIQSIPIIGSENIWSAVLRNPTNFVGELLVLISIPRYIDIGKNIASVDLNLLLFKLLIASQNKPIGDLLADDKFVDPYTGNRPYLLDYKLCYPAWPNDSDASYDVEPVCMKAIYH
ncbi:hypothetical protein J7384_03565 [Endozoicomonas sp. G2_1]|uniref:hypothetical protein n=1 Tax=Endozoicomonas sp. G2_1 TaxID=2821091 RepID=UPI001ADCA8A7|nr:hypothetical protein [Endozoicomonas sp. G2_1]MBO9489433.1 hypothetical protein [Endozoicomonas sp. G2_1]